MIAFSAQSTRSARPISWCRYAAIFSAAMRFVILMFYAFRCPVSPDICYALLLTHFYRCKFPARMQLLSHPSLPLLCISLSSRGDLRSPKSNAAHHRPILPICRTFARFVLAYSMLSLSVHEISAKYFAKVRCLTHGRDGAIHTEIG